MSISTGGENMFDEYFSNVSVGTGNNFILEFSGDQTVKARAFFKVEVSGRFNYRFFFQNTVNSTFSEGEVAYVNKSGGNWRINSATVGTASLASRDGNIENAIRVTFDGNTAKSISPDEIFWSDEVEIDIPDGKYLVWEWEVEGNSIPCTPDSIVPTFVTCDEKIPGANCPLPNFIGCDKRVKKRIAFAGDSITQGCGTGIDKYEMWVSRIGKMLREDYSVWNLGLGCCRASDAATMGSLMYKIKQNDVVILTYGVNDLFHGKFGSERHATAGELLASIEKIVKELRAQNIEVVLSTIPPFIYDKAGEAEWRCVNMAIPTLASLYGCRVYDFEARLDGSPLPLGNDHSKYGPHPDGEGGKAAAEAFKDTFFDGTNWTL